MEHRATDRLESAFFAVMTNRNLLKEITKHQGGKKWNVITSGDWAAKNGHLSLLREKRDLKFTKKAMNWAAAYGRLDIVEWLHENRTEGCTKSALNRAVKFGHTDVIEWLVKNKPEIYDDDIRHYAIREDNPKLLEWLHKNAGNYNPIADLNSAAYWSGERVTNWICDNYEEVRDINVLLRARAHAPKRSCYSVYKILTDKINEMQ
jgi:hypothetical protein